jgi:hypothetical protein
VPYPSTVIAATRTLSGIRAYPDMWRIGRTDFADYFDCVEPAPNGLSAETLQPPLKADLRRRCLRAVPSQNRGTQICYLSAFRAGKSSSLS